MNNPKAQECVENFLTMAGRVCEQAKKQTKERVY